jgi:hypothetical protein
VDSLVAFTVGVRHQNRYIVARVADVVIQNHPTPARLDLFFHGGLQEFGRRHVAGKGTDIGFDYAQSSLHKNTSS